MSIKDILAVLTQEDSGVSLDAAAALGERFDAHVEGVYVSALPDAIYSDAALSSAFAGELISLARKAAAEDLARLDARAKALPRAVQNKVAESVLGAVGETAGLFGRHADLAVVTQPEEGKAGLQRRVIEGLLFGSGRPVLVIPRGWKPSSIGARILVAWNASREAARAAADAHDFLHGAESVTVLTVDAAPSLFGHGDQPGADFAQHLSRHGLKVAVRNADGLGRTASARILEEAASIGADLIVMGGYGHARFQEMIFGGATRDMLTAATIPILMSH